MSKLQLDDLIISMYSTSFMYTVYYLKTNSLVHISDDMESHEIDSKILDDIENGENFLLIPQILQKDIMKSFVFTLTDTSKQEMLLDIINNPGYLKKFKIALSGIGLAKDYYEYEEKKYYDTAKSWCEENDIEYKE